MNYNTKSKSGFTIIEVVLVLAIAGLIFLIVFLAVPALQRGQRDTQRRNDLGRATSALQQFQSNSRGTLPTAAQLADTGATGFTARYLTNSGSTFSDPTTGSTYTFNNGGNGAGNFATPAQGVISFRTNAVCGDTGYTAGSGRNIALVVTLETGGQYCQSI